MCIDCNLKIMLDELYICSGFSDYNREIGEHYVCDNCVFEKDINCTTNNCYYCTRGWCLNNTTERYCNKCTDLLSISDNQTDANDYISDDSDDYLDEEQIQRKNLLINKLNENGCELRSDSKLCNKYIEYGTNDLDYVVTIMIEMKFYFNHTKYGSFFKICKDKEYNNFGYYDSSEISQIAKEKALENWCSNIKYCEAIKCKYLPNSLYKNVHLIIGKKYSKIFANIYKLHYGYKRHIYNIFL
jgi:hypothetical protein